MLQTQQSALPIQASGESAKTSIRSQHAVAGDQDRQRVAAQCSAYCPHRTTHPNAPGQISVADCLPERDCRRLAPHRPAEFARAGRQANIQFEHAPFTRQILSNLLNHRMFGFRICSRHNGFRIEPPKFFQIGRHILALGIREFQVSHAPIRGDGNEKHSVVGGKHASSHRVRRIKRKLDCAHKNKPRKPVLPC